MHKKLPQSTVKLVLPSNGSYESKAGCNRTLATVLWVPLNKAEDAEILVTLSLQNAETSGASVNCRAGNAIIFLGFCEH